MNKNNKLSKLRKAIINCRFNGIEKGFQVNRKQLQHTYYKNNAQRLIRWLRELNLDVDKEVKKIAEIKTLKEVQSYFRELTA